MAAASQLFGGGGGGGQTLFHIVVKTVTGKTVTVPVRAGAQVSRRPAQRRCMHRVLDSQQCRLAGSRLQSARDVAASVRNRLSIDNPDQPAVRLLRNGKTLADSEIVQEGQVLVASAVVSI